MPIIDTLVKSICQQFSDPTSQSTAYCSTLGFTYVCSYLNLDPETANYCNFNILSGNMSGTYRFQSGFYGLTDMPAELQKAMDFTLIGLKNTYCFLDDKLIVSRGSKKEHKNKCLIVLTDLMRKI